MHLLIAAAGSGRRMGERNKLLLPVAGRPVLAWTLEAALATAEISWIGLVGQSRDQVDVEALVTAAAPDRPVCWIEGARPGRIQYAWAWGPCRRKPRLC